MPKVDERNGENLGREGRRFTNSKIFYLAVAGILGIGGGSGGSYWLTESDSEQLRDLHDKYILLEQKFEIQQENFKELSVVKEKNLDARLSRMENDIKTILTKLDRK